MCTPQNHTLMMELGALVCTARKPRCGSCPVKDACRAQPEITESLARLSRGAKKEKGYQYKGSNRYLRGRVLARLRDASKEGVALRELGSGLREGFCEKDVPWIYGVVRSLQKDGLATVCEGRPAYATAAERPAYGAEENDEWCDPGETRVRLP